MADENDELLEALKSLTPEFKISQYVIPVFSSKLASTLFSDYHSYENRPLVVTVTRNVAGNWAVVRHPVYYLTLCLTPSIARATYFDEEDLGLAFTDAINRVSEARMICILHYNAKTVQGIINPITPEMIRSWNST